MYLNCIDNYVTNINRKSAFSTIPIEKFLYFRDNKRKQYNSYKYKNNCFLNNMNSGWILSEVFLRVYSLFI